VGGGRADPVDTTRVIRESVFQQLRDALRQAVVIDRAGYPVAPSHRRALPHVRARPPHARHAAAARHAVPRRRVLPRVAAPEGPGQWALPTSPEYPEKAQVNGVPRASKSLGVLRAYPAGGP